MSSDSIAIRLEHVSKRYRAGRSRTIVDLAASTIDSLRGRSQAVYSVSRGRMDANVWALQDVTFDVPAGEGLGIIGANGAGKTTLLKLISRVTWPTGGRVQVAGRVVSLIELGAGFHPELTGRENVYLGGGLFGLSRREIDRRFDDIVQFAEVQPLIDTPMKRYSSGLYARLGFAVAIYSDPDIVLVDEVLAVGDAAFRRRALESLRRLIADGKTVLFISHDMWNVRRLCQRILWMESGQVRGFGPAAEIAEEYMAEVNLRAVGNQQNALQSHRAGTGEVRFTAIEIVDHAGREVAAVAEGSPLVVRASYAASMSVSRPVFQVAIVDVDTGLVVATATSAASEVPEVVSRDGAIECRFDALPLRRRQYVLRMRITDAQQLMSYDEVLAGPRFAVTAGLNAAAASAEDEDGLVSLPFRFDHHQPAGAAPHR
jgi:ABC-type polysaccharide/polyol phosphate transport system ATPase subunit